MNEKKINIPFYVIMSLCLLATIAISAWEFVAGNAHSGTTNAIAALMFALILFRQISVDRDFGRIIHYLNWGILFFIFICIAAEGGWLYK